MKSKFTLIALAAILVVAGAGTSAFAEIAGTAHDFSGEMWSGGQICGPCHTPHGASSAAALWARGSLPDQGSYQLFDLGSDPVNLGTGSLTCLSCHDGTLALEGVGGTTFITGADLIGTDLTDDHPIGMAYETNTASTRWVVPPANGVRLSGGQVECSSCHQVHGTDNDFLLRASILGSELCLSCHNR